MTPTSKFVVTGCSRSGTQFISRLLSSVGYRCGHEAIFNYEYLSTMGHARRAFVDFPDVDGDSSSGAAPFLHELPPGTIVLHQLRHPIDCLRSHMGIRSFARPHVPSRDLADDHVEQVAFFEGRFCPAIFRHDQEVVRGMSYWILWNRLVEPGDRTHSQIYFRYRIEDVNLRLLRHLVTLLGVPASELGDGDLETALVTTSRSANARRRDEAVTWNRLPDCPEKTALARLAVEYGYTM